MLKMPDTTGFKAYFEKLLTESMFNTYEEAAEKASTLMKNIGTANVSYYPKEIEIELNEDQSSGINMKL